ncbi:murein biosynthesis integral membrane protein MurJ [Anthocerotibacter panamensis]|uniref:murein biosynthesis integral membrane protein MurJ n=1 Tax=Anthocerotibacter panamensis TaxID=2857077 RepID=UPI001C4081DE|nr:murein biosynthesis integral membrane protein MurJ [Anthocerotibacter panamensis]
MSPKPAAQRSVLGVGSVVGLATLFSKMIGLLRDLVMASVFGIGVDAFIIANKLPGFLLILLGGVNGPFHSAVVSVVARQERRETAELMESVNTVVGLLLGVVSLGLWWGAPFFVGLVAQGAPLDIQVQAIGQLRVMAPVALFAGLIGLGFGVLTARDHYLLPTISPIFSSGAAVLAIVLFAPVYGPQVLAWGVLGGAVLQWLIQLIVQWRLGLGTLRPRWRPRDPQVQKVLGIAAPASGSSLLLNVNVYTDLFFATQLAVGVATALEYANRLIQTPLGILSNVLLIPALPLYSRLAAEEDRPELRLRVRQGVLIILVWVLPVSALAIALAEPLVSVIFERGNFTARDTLLVAQVFAGGALGMTFYLTRDLLIRVFYALGDARFPLKVSTLGIATNLLLDWLLSRLFGAPGLTLASTGVSAIACAVLVGGLRRRMAGLGWAGLGRTFTLVALGSLLTGGGAWGTYSFLGTLWPAVGLLAVGLKLTVAGLLGIVIQGVWLWIWRIPEVNELTLLRRVGRGKR